jgi:hypothetical protein
MSWTISFNGNFFGCSKYNHAMTFFNNVHRSGYGALSCSVETEGAPSMMKEVENFNERTEEYPDRKRKVDRKLPEEKWWDL